MTVLWRVISAWKKKWPFQEVCRKQKKSSWDWPGPLHHFVWGYPLGSYALSRVASKILMLQNILSWWKIYSAVTQDSNWSPQRHQFVWNTGLIQLSCCEIWNYYDFCVVLAMLCSWFDSLNLPPSGVLSLVGGLHYRCCHGTYSYPPK